MSRAFAAVWSRPARCVIHSVHCGAPFNCIAGLGGDRWRTGWPNPFSQAEASWRAVPLPRQSSRRSSPSRCAPHVHLAVFVDDLGFDTCGDDARKAKMISTSRCWSWMSLRLVSAALWAVEPLAASAAPQRNFLKPMLSHSRATVFICDFLGNSNFVGNHHHVAPSRRSRKRPCALGGQQSVSDRLLLSSRLVQRELEIDGSAAIM